MKRKLEEIVAAAKLVGIDVVKYRWERGHPDVAGPLKLPPQVTTTINLHVGIPQAFPVDAASFLCGMLVTVTHPEDPNIILGVIEVQVRVAYELKGLASPLTDEEGSEFGQVTAIHQAWPFLRERLRTASSEIGLNPVVLPLNKAGLEVKQAARAATAEPVDASLAPGQGARRVGKTRSSKAPPKKKPRRRSARSSKQ